MLELESFNLPLAQKSVSALGSQCLKFGRGGQAYRCEAAADHTGHAILPTPYEMTLEFDLSLSIQYCAMDLIIHMTTRSRLHYWAHGGRLQKIDCSFSVKYFTLDLTFSAQAPSEKKPNDQLESQRLLNSCISAFKACYHNSRW